MTGPGMVLVLPVVGERVALEPSANSERVLLRRLVDGTEVGFATLARAGDALVIVALVVDEPFRGYGIGSEAARLLIESAATSGYARVRASAPPHRGLATYFWYRMGLRASHGEGPNGGLLFERIGPTQDAAQDGGTIGSR